MQKQTMGLSEWILLVVLSVLWGGSFFFIKIVLKDLQPLTVVLSRVSLAAIALTTFVFLKGKRMPISPSLWGEFLVVGTLSPSAATWEAVLGLSLLSTAIAYLIYFQLLAVAGATNLLLVTFLIPVSALGLGVFILGEQLQWTEFFSMLLIFAGLADIDGRLVSRIQQLI